MPERLKGRSPPRHGDFTVGPPFCAGEDRLRPLSRTQEPGLVLEVRLPFLDIHLAEWRPVSRARREIDDLTRDLGEWRNRFGGDHAAEAEARLTADLKDAEKARVYAENARDAASAEMTAEIQ